MARHGLPRQLKPWGKERMGGEERGGRWVEDGREEQESLMGTLTLEGSSVETHGRHGCSLLTPQGNTEATKQQLKCFPSTYTQTNYSSIMTFISIIPTVLLLFLQLLSLLCNYGFYYYSHYSVTTILLLLPTMLCIMTAVTITTTAIMAIVTTTITRLQLD